MALTFDQILEGLAALKAEDFGDSVPRQLFELTDELMTVPQPELGIPALFDVMERLPGADFGCPGPLVHTLEAMQGHYESELIESVRRKPTPVSVWMINRILNAARDPEETRAYLELLQFAAEHPAASEETREQALHFFNYQRGENGTD